MAHWNHLSFARIESILHKKEKKETFKLISSKLYEAHYGVCHPRDARMLTTELIRYIGTKRKFERRVPSFASEIRQKILCLHEFNLKIGKIYKYPMSKQFNDLLIKYIELECESLYARNNAVDEKEEKRIRHRVVGLLQIILYDALYNNKLSMKQNIYNSKKAVFNLFVHVRADCARENKLVGSVIVQLLEYFGLLDQVNQLKGVNIAFHQDSQLSNPLVTKIRESLMTKDFEESDDFATDDEIDQISEDSLGCFNDDIQNDNLHFNFNQPINNSKEKRNFPINENNCISNGSESRHDQFLNEIQNSELRYNENENNLLEKNLSIDNNDTDCVEVVETNQQDCVTTDPIMDNQTPENRETSELSLSLPNIITIEISDDEDDDGQQVNSNNNNGQIQMLQTNEIKLEEEDEENRSPNFPLPCSDNNQDIIDASKGNKESNSNGLNVLKSNSNNSTKTVESNEVFVSNEETAVEAHITNNVEKLEISSARVDVAKIPEKRNDIVDPPTDEIVHETVNALEESHDVSFSEINTTVSNVTLSNIEISQIANHEEITTLEKHAIHNSSETASTVNKIINLPEETELADSDDVASNSSTKTVEESDHQEQDNFLCGIKVNESFVGSSEIIVMSESRFGLESISRNMFAKTNKNEEITENIQQSSEISKEVTYEKSEFDNQVEEQRIEGNDVQLVTKESDVTENSSDPVVHFESVEAECTLQSDENINTEEIHESSVIDAEEIIESSVIDSEEIVESSVSNSENKTENRISNYQELTECIVPNTEEVIKDRVSHSEVLENVTSDSEKIQKENTNTVEIQESSLTNTEEIYETISTEVSTEDYEQAVKEIESLPENANQYLLDDLPIVHATEEVVSIAEISTEDLSENRKQTAEEIDSLPEKANQYQLEEFTSVHATEEVVSTAESSDGYKMDHAESKKPSEYYEILNEEVKNNTILDLSTKEQQVEYNLEKTSALKINEELENQLVKDPIPTVEEPSVNVNDQSISTRTLYYNKDEKSASSEYENNSKTSLQFFVDIALTQETLPVKSNEEFESKDVITKESTSSVMENNDEIENNEEHGLIKPRRKPKSENVRRIRRKQKVNENFENKRITRSRSHQIVNKTEAKIRDEFDILKDSTTYNVQDFKSTSEVPPGVNNVYTRVESNITSEDSDDLESVLHITEPEVISVYDEDTVDDNLTFIQSGDQTSVCISIPETEMASGSRKFDILFEMESYLDKNEGKLPTENIETTTTDHSINENIEKTTTDHSINADEEVRSGVPEVKALSIVPTDHSIEKVLNLTCSAHIEQNSSPSEELHMTSNDENVIVENKILPESVIEEDCNNKIESAEVVICEEEVIEEEIVDNTNFKVDYSRIETLAADESTEKSFKTKAQVKSYSNQKDEDLQKSKRIKVRSYSLNEETSRSLPVSQRLRTKSINSDNINMLPLIPYKEFNEAVSDEESSMMEEVPTITDAVMNEETTINFVEQTEVTEEQTEIVEALEDTVIEEPTEIVQPTEIIELSEVVESIEVLEPTEASDQTDIVETTKVVEQMQVEALTQIAVETEVLEPVEIEVTTDIAELTEVVESTESIETTKIVEPTEVVKSSVIVESAKVVEEQLNNLTTISDTSLEIETPMDAFEIEKKTGEILKEDPVSLIENINETPPKTDEVTNETIDKHQFQQTEVDILIENYVIENNTETPSESDEVTDCKNKNKSRETLNKNHKSQTKTDEMLTEDSLIENKIESKSPESEVVITDFKNKKKSKESSDKNKLQLKTAEKLIKDPLIENKIETPPESDEVITDNKNKKKPKQTVDKNKSHLKTGQTLIEEPFIENKIETPPKSDKATDCKNKKKPKEIIEKNKLESNEILIEDPVGEVENQMETSPKSDDLTDCKGKKKSKETPDKNKVEQKTPRVSADAKPSEKAKSKDTSKSSQIIKKERALENAIKKMKEKISEVAETTSNESLIQAVNEEKTNPVKDKTHRDKKSDVTEHHSKKERDHHRRSRSSSKSSVDDKKSHHGDSVDNEKSSKRHRRSSSKSRHEKHKPAVSEATERKSSSSSSTNQSKRHLAEKHDATNKTAQLPKQERKKSDIDESSKKKTSHLSTPERNQLKDTKISSSEKKPKHESSSETRLKSSHSTECKNKGKSEDINRDRSKSKEKSASAVKDKNNSFYMNDISELFKCSVASPHVKTDGDKEIKSKSEHKSHRSHSKEKSKSSSTSKSEKRSKDEQKDNEKKKSTVEVLPKDDKSSSSRTSSKSKETTATPTTTTTATKQGSPHKHKEKDNTTKESRAHSPKKRKHDSDDDSDRKKMKICEKSSSKTKLDSNQLLTESKIEKIDKRNDKKKTVETTKHAFIKPNETQIVNKTAPESPTKHIYKEEIVAVVEKTNNTVVENTVEKEVTATSTTLTDDDKEPIVCPDAASNEFAKMLMEKYNQPTCVPEVVTDQVQPKPIYMSDCTLSEINTEKQEINPINTIIKNFSTEANNESALSISSVIPTAAITENEPTRPEDIPSCSTDELPNTEIFESAITLDEISPTKLHLGSNQSLDLISLPPINNPMNYVNSINFLNNVQEAAEIVITDTIKLQPVSSNFVRGTSKIFMEVKGSADHNYTIGDPLLSGNKEDRSILSEVFNMDDISCNAIDDFFKKENIDDTDTISIDDADPEAKPEEIQNMIKTLNQLVDKPAKPQTTSVDIITIDHNSLDHTPTTDSNNHDFGVKYAFKEICSLRSKKDTTNHPNATFPPILDINKVNIIDSGAEQPSEISSIPNEPSTINIKDIEYPTDAPSITNYMDLLPSSSGSNPKVIVQRNEPYPIIMSAEPKKEPIPKSSTSDINRSKSNISNDDSKAELEKIEKTPPTKFIETVRKSSKKEARPIYLNEPEKLYVRKNTRTPVCTNVRKSVSRQSSSGGSSTKNDSEVLFFAENLNKHDKRYMLHIPEHNKSRIRVKADLMDNERKEKSKNPESNHQKLPDLPQNPTAKCIPSNHQKPHPSKNPTKCIPSISSSPSGEGSSSTSHILDVRRRKYCPADSDPVQHHKKMRVDEELKDKGSVQHQRFSSVNRAPGEERKQRHNHTYSPLINPYNLRQHLNLALGGVQRSSKSDPHVSQSHFDRPQERRSSSESLIEPGLYDNEFTNRISELLLKENVDIFPTGPTRSSKL